MPVLASTPEQENAPMTSEDELFLGEMSQLSEGELIAIIGNMHPDMDGQNPGFEDIIACGKPSSEYDIDTWSEFVEYVENLWDISTQFTDWKTWVKWLLEEFKKYLKSQGL
ncbi:MAG: hypothetical protein QW757_05505 [Candidatus Woesearchaeota archaeon]